MCFESPYSDRSRARYDGLVSDLEYLEFEPDFASPNVIAAYDELPLWSAMFGLLLLEEVPLTGIRTALSQLDERESRSAAGVEGGSGFPLIELAERLGRSAAVHGVDPWSAALARAAEKVACRATPNVTLHEASATAMPFADGHFDLIVSNLGLNNFDDRAGAVRECRRVAKKGSVLALTTNLQGHMQELYSIFEEVLTRRGLKDELSRCTSTSRTVPPWPRFGNCWRVTGFR